MHEITALTTSMTQEWPLPARELHMRVKLCARCPYLPQDLADYYDSKASSHLCVRCDRTAAPGEVTILVSGEKKCAIATKSSRPVSQQMAALSAAEGLV
jgi:hypothetical protein